MRTGAESPRYLQLSAELAEKIRRSAWRPGDRLPSLRSMQEETGWSLNTVKGAYAQLESQGLVQPDARRGFFVAGASPEVAARGFAGRGPARVDGARAREHLELIQERVAERRAFGFALAVPDPSLLPLRPLASSMRRLREAEFELSPSAGMLRLRQAIGRLYSTRGCAMAPEHLVVTNGATEGLHLALLHLRRLGCRGVALEDPTYFEYFRILDSLGLQAVQVPCDPATGMDLRVLEGVLAEGRAQVVLVQPDVQNPLGFVMPSERREELVRLARRHGAYLIDDAVYSELRFDGRREPGLLDLDQDGRVLRVSSFSKVLSPGLRLGWLFSARFARELALLKTATSFASSSVVQSAVLPWLESGRFLVWRGRLRRRLQAHAALLRSRVLQLFPPGTECLAPRGGLSLWVKLPKGVDAEALFHRALAKGVAICPGSLFSQSPRFGSHLRLNSGVVMDHRAERALRVLAGLVRA